MKKRWFPVLVLLCGFATAASGQLPRPSGYVNDFAGVISSEAESQMLGIINQIVDKTGAEIAVAAVPSMEPYATIEQYGIALAEEWEVGSAGADDGAILIVAVEERQIRIEVGFGLEGAINDAKAGRILDNQVVPFLRNNDYSNGLLAGVAAIAQEVADEYNVALENVTVQQARSSSSDETPSVFHLIYVIAIIIFALSRRFFLPLIFLGGRHRGRYGGGFGSSRGGSGFSGFGGGGFGGGGASRGF